MVNQVTLVAVLDVEEDMDIYTYIFLHKRIVIMYFQAKMIIICNNMYT